MPANYGTVGEADTYHEERGNTAWGAVAGSPEDTKLAALVRASVWLDGRYRSRFSGSRTDGRNQEREWPRTDATDAAEEEIASDEVPIEVLHATYEAALVELASPGSLSPSYTASSQKRRVKVGPIETEYRDNVAGAAGTRPVLTVIDDIMGPLVGAPGPVLFGSTARG